MIRFGVSEDKIRAGQIEGARKLEDNSVLSEARKEKIIKKFPPEQRENARKSLEENPDLSDARKERLLKRFFKL